MSLMAMRRRLCGSAIWRVWCLGAWVALALMAVGCAMPQPGASTLRRATSAPFATATPEVHPSTDVTSEYQSLLAIFDKTLREAGMQSTKLTATEVWDTTYQLKTDPQGNEVIYPNTGLPLVVAAPSNYVVFKDGNTQLATYGQYTEMYNGVQQKALRFTQDTEVDTSHRYEGYQIAARYYQDQRATAVREGHPMPVLNAVAIPQGAEVTVAVYPYTGPKGNAHIFQYAWSKDAKTQVINVLDSGARVWVGHSQSGGPFDGFGEANGSLEDLRYITVGGPLYTSYYYYAPTGIYPVADTYAQQGKPVNNNIAGTTSFAGEVVPITPLTMPVVDGQTAPVEVG